MTRRHKQGSFSESEDLEANTPLRIFQPGEWNVVDLLWLASAAFILYMGDWNSNLISVMWKDERIKRAELYLGVFFIFLNLAVVSGTTIFFRHIRRSDAESEMQTPSTAPTIVILGLFSFYLLSVALWPIWSFLTLPLLFSLLMAVLVMLSCLRSRAFHPEVETYERTD